MILQEFMLELDSMSPLFYWSLGPGGRIQGKHVDGRHPDFFDPVTAVCFARTSKLFRREDGIRAAREIGLSPIDYGDIIAASNNVWARMARPDRYGQVLRSRLVKILGVSRTNRLTVRSALLATRDAIWGRRSGIRSRPFV